jgi:hypothetical protein
MVVAPGHPPSLRYGGQSAHLHAIKFLHLDKFLASRQIVPRHCASAHLPTFCNQDNLPATYQNCTATHVMLNKICTWTAKSAPYPPFPANDKLQHD